MRAADGYLCRDRGDTPVAVMEGNDPDIVLRVHIGKCGFNPARRTEFQAVRADQALAFVQVAQL